MGFDYEARTDARKCTPPWKGTYPGGCYRGKKKAGTRTLDVISKGRGLSKAAQQSKTRKGDKRRARIATLAKKAAQRRKSANQVNALGAVFLDLANKAGMGQNVPDSFDGFDKGEYSVGIRMQGLSKALKNKEQLRNPGDYTELLGYVKKNKNQRRSVAREILTEGIAAYKPSQKELSIASSNYPGSLVDLLDPRLGGAITKYRKAKKRKRK